MTDIDAVIAWVDGADPAHLGKRLRHASAGSDPHRDALAATRFDDAGEIYYCIASILKYAGYVRKIWIVTDEQRPRHLAEFGRAGLCRDDAIAVVDHRTVFAGLPDGLPSFNSLSIASVLWRIPGLSEQFVYFNDDCFLNRRTDPTDFFADGRPVLRGSLERPAVLRARARNGGLALLGSLGFRVPRLRPGFRLAQERGGALAGMKGGFLRVGHHPHPLRRSVQEAFYRERPEVLADQVRHRFRDPAQYSAVSLANHLEILRHGAGYGPPEAVAYLKPSRARATSPTLAAIRGDRHLSGCIQSFGEFEPGVRAVIRAMMRDKLASHLPGTIEFPEPSRSG